MSPPFKLLALLTLPLMAAGCKTDPTMGFKDVQETVARRTGQKVEWPRTSAESEKAEAAVGQLLADELTADSAVQIALLNNRALRATLEEIGMRAHESFVEAGGKEFALIPCMNEHPLWLDALGKMIRAFTNSAQPKTHAEAVPTV